MSKLLSSLLTKEQPWVICSGRSWQKSNRERIPLDFFKKEQHQWFARDLNELLSKKERFTRKIVFFICFCQFFPPFMPKSSSLCRSLKKSDRERIAPLTLFKRATVRIRSHYAWQKRDGSDLLFFTSESFFRSQKLAIRSKNWWANSQPLANTRLFWIF